MSPARYLGAVIGASRDGTYRNNQQFISWAVPGIGGYFYKSVLHLTANRSRGTFSGQFYGGGIIGTASGSFSC